MAEAKMVRVWDIWIRLFHWSIAISVVFMLISGATGWLFFDWHRLIGEWILALLVFRLLWGFLGSSNASLIHLVRSPKEALDHLLALFKRRLHSERGHNAAGGWAVLLMLLLLTIQAVTGFFIADEDELVEGALYGSLSSASTDLMYRIHHLNAELLQVVVIVHVAMVFTYLLYGRQNLILPMIHGSMQWLDNLDVPKVTFQRIWVGGVLFALSALLIGYIAGWYG
ncbi:MAG: cytochrome b/b6 domain-containing protein [Granulosicoccus sp.]